jgi:tetratricopeptide (TPR) repeat protein
MTVLSSVLILALWQNAAGAQASLSPEQLLEQYTATGESALLERCRTLIAGFPRNNRSRLLHARLLLASGETKQALIEAAELNRDIPDELDPYGIIVDAALLLGDIKRAETAGEWMLRLRPEDVRSLARGAAVREAIEDYDGAAQMLMEALGRTPRTDVAVRAGIGVALARLSMRRGRADDAARLLEQVDSMIPGFRPGTLLKREMEKKQ